MAFPIYWMVLTAIKPAGQYLTATPQFWPHGITWSYFGEGYNNGHPGPNYCGICDPMQYATSVMTNPAKLAAAADVARRLGHRDAAMALADLVIGLLPAGAAQTKLEKN